MPILKFLAVFFALAFCVVGAIIFAESCPRWDGFNAVLTVSGMALGYCFGWAVGFNSTGRL